MWVPQLCWFGQTTPISQLSREPYLIHNRAQGCFVLGIPTLEHALGHQLFEHDADRGDLFDLALRWQIDDGAAMGRFFYQTLFDQTMDGLTDGDAAHAQLVGQFALDELRTRRERATLDGIAQPHRGLVC